MYEPAIREEGRAARKLGLAESVNPYRKTADLAEKMKHDSSRLYEMAAEWSNGWHIPIPLDAPKFYNPPYTDEEN